MIDYNKLIKRKVSTFHVCENTDVNETYTGQSRIIEIMKYVTSILKPIAVKKYQIPKNASLETAYYKWADFISDIESKYDVILLYKTEDNVSKFYVIRQVDFINRKLFYIPVGYLLELKKKNRRLHNLLVMCYAILVNEIGVGNMGSGKYYNIDQIKENYIVCLEEEDPGPLDYYRTMIKEYDRIVPKYISKFYSNVDLDVMKKEIKYFEKNSSNDIFIKNVIDLCNKVIGLTRYESLWYYEEQSIIMFDKLYRDRSDDEGYAPITIRDVVNLIWENDDEFIEMQCQYMGECDGNYGSAEYSPFAVVESSEDIIKFLEGINQHVSVINEYIETLSLAVDVSEEGFSYVSNKLIDVLT